MRQRNRNGNSEVQHTDFFLTDRYNKSGAVSNAQKIQKWALLPLDFSQPTGELNNTLKLKRSFVQEKYKDIIDSMYIPNKSLDVASKLWGKLGIYQFLSCHLVTVCLTVVLCLWKWKWHNFFVIVAWEWTKIYVVVIHWSMEKKKMDEAFIISFIEWSWQKFMTTILEWPPCSGDIVCKVHLE